MDEQRRQQRMRAYLSNVVEGVARYGWIVQGVFPTEPGHYGFAYTVGLAAKGHPELISFGLPVEVAQDVLNDLAGRTLAGQTIAPGLPLYDVIVGHPVRFLEVREPTEHLGMSSLLYGSTEQPVRALQVVFPDRHGRWPWEDGSELAELPILGDPQAT